MTPLWQWWAGIRYAARQANRRRQETGDWRVWWQEWRYQRRWERQARAEMARWITRQEPRT